MAFFTFSQNNPFGSFWIDHDRGISSYVIIEADDQESAVSKGEGLGMVFYGNECECCGSRWSYPMEEHPEPRVYDEMITEFVPSSTRARYGFSGYVHYADGRIEPFGGEIEP